MINSHRRFFQMRCSARDPELVILFHAHTTFWCYAVFWALRAVFNAAILWPSYDFIQINQQRIHYYQFCISLNSSNPPVTKAFKAFIFSLFLIFTVPQNAMAGTTTAEFLKWDRKAQESFFDVSLTMVGFVSAQTKPRMAECINNWYFKTKSLQSKRNENFLREMPKYKSYHPTAVLLGFIEKACGKFWWSNLRTSKE